jgi:inosose dehydratase
VEFLDRVAGAPISWGVCEVPGWGLMLGADRVLAEMRSVGLTATELGAPGFLPETSTEINAKLAEYSIDLIGGFVPLILHDKNHHLASLEEAREIAALFAECGATRFVTAVVRDENWSRPDRVTDADITSISEGLKLVDEICSDFGLVQVLHPHFDTMIETADEMQRLLDQSDVKWCLDTGHIALGGYDVVEFARKYTDRVAHVHLKDVDLEIAAKARSRELSLLQAVQAGLFPPLGEGDVPVGDVVRELENRGYQGRYVLEQDLAITDGEPARGEGPILGVRTTLDYLASSVVPILA